MWIKISPEQEQAARTHTPPGAHTSQALSACPDRPRRQPPLPPPAPGGGPASPQPSPAGAQGQACPLPCLHAGVRLHGGSELAAHTRTHALRTRSHAGTGRYTRAHRAGTPGLTPHRDTHGYPCTDLTHAGELRLPRLSGHTQKPRDIMAGTHLDLFSS